MSTKIFLEYCQQKAWANNDGLALIGYEYFLREFDRFSCHDGCQWPVTPGCKQVCRTSKEKQNG